MDTYKKINAILFLSTILIGCIAYMYWDQVCIVQNACDYHERTGFFRPLFQACVWGGLTTTIFLFLPSRYFKTWLRKIFSWGFPLSLILVLGVDPQSSNLLNPTRSQAPQFLGIAFLVLTVFFIFIQYRRDRKSREG